MYNNYYNPYQPFNYGQRQEIIHVNGRQGADAYQLAPNSSALLLDENEPLVWLVTTDGAGYKSISPYTIAPYEPKAAPNLETLEERIKKLEERLSNESDTATVKQRKRSASEPDES